MAVTPVIRVEELPQAVVAGCDVGRDERALRGCAALGDREACPAGRFDDGERDGLDLSEPRRLAAQLGSEGFERPRFTLRFDHDAAPVVSHEPRELVASREAVHEGPKADALDDAADDEQATLDGRHAASVAKTVQIRKKIGVFPLPGVSPDPGSLAPSP